MKNTTNEIYIKINNANKTFFLLKKKYQNDIDNILNRSKQEVNNTYKYSLSNIIKIILLDMDNLEKAIELCKQDKSLKTVQEKLNKILISISDVLRSHGVISINEINIPFDPIVHQAISMIKNKKIKNNYVIEIMQKGYKIYNRLLRPAMVIVSS